MHLIRECEEKIRREYSSNDIKTPTHLAIGEEAIAVGIVSTFPTAKYFATYRNHGVYLACGGDLDEFWGELYGKETGCAKGKAGSMHLSAPDRGLVLTSAIVGTTIPVAVGSAWAINYENSAPKQDVCRGPGPSSALTICFFGDGATEEGVFHESLNFANLHKLPILFVCEDNSLAIHAGLETRQKYNLQKLVESYGIPYRSAEGYRLDNVLKIAEYIKPLVTTRPCFLHIKYHRFYEHVGPAEDYDVGYRPRPFQSTKLDPLKTLETDRCVKTLSSEKKQQIRVRAATDVSNAAEKAKHAKFPPLSELTTDVFEAL